MERKFWIRTIALGLVAIAVLLGGGGYYLTHMQNSLWDQSVSNSLELTVQGAKSFEIFLDQGYDMLAGRANIFAEYSSADVDPIGTKLELYENGDQSFAVIDITNKVIYYNSAEQLPLPDASAEQYLTLPQRGFLEPFLSEYTGRHEVAYYERFTFADGAQGMVRKTIPVTELAEKFSLSFYDGAGFSYIINADGDIVLRSVTEHGNRTFSNIFDVVALDDNTPQRVAQFRSAVSGGKWGVMSLSFGGEEHMFAFVPISNLDEWYLISVIPSDIIMEHANKVLMSSQLLVAVVGTAAVILFSFILITVHHRREVMKKETEVVYREQLFDLLSQSATDVFMMLSADGTTVQYISPNVERVIGVTPQEVKEDFSRLQVLLHSDAAECKKPDESSPMTIDGHYTNPSTGEERWFTETVYHTMLQSTERYIVVLADRTADRQKEAALAEALDIAQAANRSKSAFLSNMSHDIRTPMNAIVGLATLLQRDADDPELVREHTRKVTASSQHLLGLINDVLDMSKIESGKTTLNIGEFSLAELIDELGTIIRPQAKAKKQSFEITAQNICNEHLLGDKLRISQVMINILSNAVKYTQVGGSVNMAVEQIDMPSAHIAHIIFRVADNGIGMSDEFKRDIFQPFSREVRTVVNKVQGTGLGMAITKSLVDLMGGTISVDSELGEGSTFTVELDLRIQEQEDDQEFWKEHEIGHMLVVDDEEDICTGIVSAMSATGVRVEYVLSGSDAIKLVETAHKRGDDFDFILLDWKMPEMDGIETARQLRETVSASIPIMTITSFDLEDIRDEGIAAGVDGFMPKPFFLSNFKEVVRTINIGRSVADAAPVAHDRLVGLHLLCAEDNELNAEILVELLNMESITCDRAVDGQEAVDAFLASSDGTYDAILMDVQMPIMDGYEATRRIRGSDHPQAKTIPIIAMTANAFADDVRDALESGMNAHVAKPIDMARLMDALEESIERDK